MSGPIDLSGLPPLPWTPAKVFEGGWGYSVLAADGTDLSAHEVWADDAGLMATIHAFGPTLLQYVEQAASRGGNSAIDLIARFKKARAEINKTPEEMTALRRARAGRAG